VNSTAIPTTTRRHPRNARARVCIRITESLRPSVRARAAKDDEKPRRCLATRVMARRSAMARSIARRPPSSDIKTVYPYNKKTHTRIVFPLRSIGSIHRSIVFTLRTRASKAGFHRVRVDVYLVHLFMTYGYVVVTVIKKLGRAETPVTAERDRRDDR